MPAVVAPSTRPFRVIDPTAEDIDEIWTALEAELRWAMDIEADSFYRYFEKVCLIQISTPQADYYFDPLEHELPARLRKMLIEPGRTLVMHGADFDVRVMKQSFGLPLGSIFDTTLAARFLGIESFGLKALLSSELGIDIDKNEQRSDWGRRPLSDSQLHYARQDTMHLLALADGLEAKLEAASRRPWHAEECERLRAVEPTVKTFDPEGWRKIKGAKVLGAAGRKALSGLFAWRDARARSVDKSPFRVVRNENLLRTAKAIDAEGPGVLRGQNGYRILPKGLPRRDLIRVIESALDQPDPGTRRPKSTDNLGVARPSISKSALEHFKKERAAWSQDLGLEPGFLMPLTVLERVIRARPSTPDDLRRVEGLTDWRIEALGPRIMAALTVMDRDKEC